MMVQYSLADQRVIDALDILRSIMRDSIQKRASLMEVVSYDKYFLRTCMYFILEEADMRLKKLPLYFLAAGLALLITVGIFLLLPAQPVSAQCGSQASSCKNCHETQAKDPVNNDGTAWHTSHAFGDFCYLCHAGNNQATDEDRCPYRAWSIH